MADNAHSNLDVIVRGVDELSPELNRMESKVIRFVGAIGASLAAIKAISFPIRASAEFEAEMANVAKTTNFTRTQIAGLGGDLLDLSLTMDVSATDLAKIAAQAGQQGLGREGSEGILRFTAAVARMSSVLDISAEDSALQIGKIANIFKLPFDKLESAVASFNQVSNNSTASGEELLDVVRRLGDASGTINLSESIGLSATALDFGVRQEVAGTSLSKIFAQMLQKSKQFGKLLHMSSAEWTDIVTKDGVDAYKRALAGIQKLKPDQQQAAIAKLFGAGRIGSMANKFVQDTTNAVLDRNLAQAKKGYDDGLSALREQAIKQNTLAAQSKILLNSIQKDAIQAGDQLTGPLIKDIIDLKDALQDPGVRSFINEIVASIGDLIGVISGAIRRVAGLNINWENFLNVGKAFLALKLAEVFGAIGSSMLGLDTRMKSMALSARAAATASKEVGAAGALRVRATGVVGVAGQGVLAPATKEAKSVDEATSAYQRLKAVKDEIIARQKVELAQIQAIKEANAQLAASRVAEATAVSTANSAEALVSKAQRVATATAGTASGAQSIVFGTRDAQAGSALGTYATYNSKLEQAEIAHQQRMQTIQVEYQKKIEAARALGRNKAGTEAVEDSKLYLANMTANEEKHHARSIASTKQYYEKKLVTDIAYYEEALIAQEGFLATAQARAARAQNVLANKRGASVAATEGVAAAGAVVATSKGALSTIPALAPPATRALGTLTLALKGVGYALQTVGRVALGAFFWVTILYSIADALGLLDGLSDRFQTLTDKIGLTSAAERKRAVDQQVMDDAHKKNMARLDEEIGKYEKLIDIQSGSYSKDLAQAASKRAGHGTDKNEREAAFHEIIDVGAGADAKLTKLQDATDAVASKKALEAAKAARAQTFADLEAANAKLSQLKIDEESANARSKSGRDGGGGGDYGAALNLSRTRTELAETQAQSEKLAAALSAQDLAISQSAKQLNGEYSGSLNSVVESSKRATEAVAAMFSDQSAALAQKYLPAIRAALQEQEAATAAQAEQSKKLTDAVNSKASDDVLAKAQAVSDEADRRLAAANRDVDAQRDHLRKSVSDILASGSIQDPQIIKSLKDLNFYGLQTTSNLDQLIRRLNDAMGIDPFLPLINSAREFIGLPALVSKKALALTAVNAGVADAPPATGDDDFKSGRGADSGESEANKIAKAKIKLQNAETEAEIARKKELNDQKSRLDDDSYKHGLMTLEKYYKAREVIELEDNNNALQAKQKELDLINAEISKATKQSEKLQYQAQAAQLKGQIDVLQLKVQGIHDKTRIDTEAAALAFSDRVTAETNKAFASMTLPASVKEQFASALAEQEAQYRDYLASLGSAAEQADAGGDPAKAAAFRAQQTAIAEQQALAAFEATKSNSDTRSQLVLTDVEQKQRAINILREKGAITGQEAEAEYNATIAAALPLMEQELAAQEALLAMQEKGTPMYQKKQQEINDTRLKLRELAEEANATAKSINQGVTDSLGNMLGQLQPTMKSLKDSLLGFFRDIAQDMQRTLGKSIAESLMKSINGPDGTAGLGGGMQSVMQGGGFLSMITGAMGHKAEAPAPATALSTGALGAPLGLSTPGATPANPVYTKDTAGVDGLLSGGGLGQGAPGTPGVFGAAATGLLPPGSTPANAIYTKSADDLGISGAFGGSSSKKDDGLAKLGTTLADSYGDNTDKAIDANQTQSLASTGQIAGGVAMVGSVVSASGHETLGAVITIGAQIVQAIIMQTMAKAVGSAHTGGIIGATGLRTRHVSPRVFAGASRYHTGGVVGLSPDEVPIVAKRGEEVLTARDPRHRNNNAGTGGSGASTQLSQTLLFDAGAAAAAILTGDNLLTHIRPHVKPLRQLLGVK